MKVPDLVVPGKDNGEGMVIHYQTVKGTHVFGLGMPNIYTNTDWDLGPTWCYLIVGQKTTLIDTGRYGNIENLKSLLKRADKALKDIDRIIITHSHEDHDGNLADVLSVAKAELWAHSIFQAMISYYPHIEDGARHPELPGSCRMCPMPKKYLSNCSQYQKGRSVLNVDFAVDRYQPPRDDKLTFVFTPGHSPDSVCVILEDEAIFTGDTILPDITPHPSLESAFEPNRRILLEEYQQKNVIYGLMAYLKSLNKLGSLTSETIAATFPAHRLFYNGQFNIIHNCSERAKEIIEFHIDRCHDILTIIKDKPASIDEIATQLFPPIQIRGTGMLLAQDEVKAHLEVMEECRDVRWVGDNKDLVQSTGANNYLGVMGKYLEFLPSS
jgi:glyoxylase-like metal-dependent hydrolase (beta-lactamase superfamily II)